MYKETIVNSMKTVECLRKLKMQDKSPGLISRDFRENDCRGVCVRFK